MRRHTTGHSSHRTLSPSRSQMSNLGSSRLPVAKTSHPPYNRKRSHSPDLSPTRKLQREYEMKMDRYQEIRKEVYEDKRDVEISTKSRSSSDLKYKSYNEAQDSRGSYSSHETRITKSSTSRERPLELDHRISSRSGGSSRREPSPLYPKEVSKSYHSSDGDKRFYEKSYDSQRRNPESSSSYNDIYTDKQIRGRERSSSPQARYKSSDKEAEDLKLSYRREDLEKIMVDIRRNVKDPSPTRRAIIRPEEVKIVRRPDEGARPLFAREEIQNPPVDLREDALLERRIISVKPTVEERDVGRIRAHRDDDDKNPTREIDLNPYSEISSHPSMTLSQRWQSFDSRKTSRLLSPEASSHYRERSLEKLSRSHSQTRDSRSRYKERSPVKEYRSTYGLASPDMSSTLRRKDSGDAYGLDEPKKYSSRASSERKDPYYSSRESSGYRSRNRVGGRSYDSPDRLSRSRNETSRTSDNKLRSLSREREKSNLPDFSQRPDRYKYDSRNEKPDSIPKGSNYYEVAKNHDDRNRPNFRSRGRGIRGFRSRGGFDRGGRRPGRFTFRGRNFRSRGGGGYNPMKRAKSPSLWEHDMFNKMSPPKNEDENPSIST